jgi:hypothetical protein
MPHQIIIGGAAANACKKEKTEDKFFHKED